MSDTKLHRVWLQKSALIMVAILVIFYSLIPFSLFPSAYPYPDVYFGIICALIIRRPEIVPFWMIALIYFGFDLFLSKPFGAWTICVLVASEYIRSNRDLFRENLFLFEWLYVSLVFFFALLANRLIWTVSLTPTPPVLNLFWELLFTAISYPFVIFIITYIFRIKKPALGVFGHKGQKL